jgi:hypothetical protein
MDMPLLIYFERSEVSVLMNTDKPLPEFKPLKSRYLRAGGIYFKPGVFSRTKNHFDWNLNMGPERVIFWRIAADSDIEEEIYTLYHEYFHSSRQMKFAPITEVPYVPEALKDGTVSRYYLEDILLMRALLTAGEERISYIKDFECLRDKGYKSEDNTVKDFEVFKEAIEGSAEYVGWRALAPAGVNDFEASSLLIPRAMSRHRAGLFTYAGANSDIRFYSSGAQLMLMLDAIRVPWKQRLERGESIYVIVRDYFPPDNCSGRISRLKRDYNFDGLLAAAKESSSGLHDNEAQKAGSVGDMSGKPRVIIENMPSWGSRPPQSYNTPVKLDKSATLYDNAELDLPAKHGVRLTVKRLPLVYSNKRKKGDALGRQGEIVSGYEIFPEDLSDIEISIDGRIVPEGKAFKGTFKKLSLMSLRLNLDTELPGEMSIDSGTVRIVFN